MARVERWFFYQDAGELWRWARLDAFGTVLGYSGSAFGSREECIEDARRSGFVEDPATATVNVIAVDDGSRPTFE